jgi:hypothetical protein
MTSFKEHIRAIEETTSAFKKMKKRMGKQFTFVTADRVASSDAWISGLGWTDITTPGGVVNCSVGISNPNTHQVHNLYVHLWVGSGIVEPIVDDTFLFNVDARFPRLLEPRFNGLTVNPR